MHQQTTRTRRHCDSRLPGPLSGRLPRIRIRANAAAGPGHRRRRRLAGAGRDREGSAALRRPGHADSPGEPRGRRRPQPGNPGERHRADRLPRRRRRMDSRVPAGTAGSDARLSLRRGLRQRRHRRRLALRGMRFMETAPSQGTVDCRGAALAALHGADLVSGGAPEACCSTWGCSTRTCAAARTSICGCGWRRRERPSPTRRRRL